MSSRHVPNDCVSRHPTLSARNALQPLHIPFIKEGFHSPPNVIRSTVDRGLLPSFDQPRGVSLLIGSKSVYCLPCLTLLLIQINRYTNVQELRLQEAQEESTSHAGRTPRQLEVELTDELIDSCRPGDIVLLACYVDAVNSAIAAGRAGKRALETSTYKLFLQGHSITTLSESSNQRGQKKESIVYTQQQLQNITQLCHADHRCLSLVERRAFPFDLLVRSLCPSIIGHHAVKAGILLCLLGGTPPASQQADRGSTIRSNSHILIVGDPGTCYDVRRLFELESIYSD